MPIFFQQELNKDTRLAVWKIEEPEHFFLQAVTLQRSITHPHKRLQHLAGRYLLKLLFPQFPVELIEIADTRKPFLKDETYHFSVSHCGDYAAAIVSSSERVGIDIEIPTVKVQRIAHKFLHPEEEARLQAFHDAPRDIRQQTVNLLTLFWSGKEAMFKWWGLGNVDFSEMLRISGVFPDDNGVTDAQLVLPNKTIPLLLSYVSFDQLVLAWVHTRQ